MKAFGYIRYHVAMERIPLRRKDGSVVDHALVDDKDATEISALRWYLGSRGYAMRQYRDGDRMRGELMHRRILGLVKGDGLEVDHVNRIKLDNRRENLRVISHAENEQNKTGARARSGVRGVHWDAGRKKWMARVVVNGRMIVRGYFDTVEEAAPIAAALREEHHPFAPGR